MFTTAADRRHALYDLYADCDPADPVPTYAEACKTARAVIVGAIRTHFPRDSADAYTAAELAKYCFNPYE